MTDLRRTRGPGYYARIGLVGAAARWRRTAVEEALALGRFDPGPPAGEHDDFCDLWRKARVAVEINRATGR